MKPRRWRLGRHIGLAGLLLLGSKLGCVAGAPTSTVPDGLLEQLRSADPSHPPFERTFLQGGSLLECLLEADQFLFPGFEKNEVRAAFQRLEREARSHLLETRSGAPDARSSVEAVRAILRTLRNRGFDYDRSQAPPGHPDSGVFSFTLLYRKGSCATFSLLCMTFLDELHLPSSIVCLPDHCFVRIEHEGRSIDVESTDLDEPLRGTGWGRLDAARDSDAHYGRSLNHEETLWHYYADKLWRWSSWRESDAYSLGILARARGVLGSSCQSLESQEARRYLAIARTVGSSGRDSSWRESYARYQNLRGHFPEDPEYPAALSALEEMAPPASQKRDERLGRSSAPSSTP